MRAVDQTSDQILQRSQKELDEAEIEPARVKVVKKDDGKYDQHKPIPFIQLSERGSFAEDGRGL